MNSHSKEPISSTLLYYLLAVMLFCTAPHLSDAPWWLSLVIIATIVYRFMANHYHYPQLATWKIFAAICFFISLLYIEYGHLRSSQFFIGMLITLFWLKIIEIRYLRDLQVLLLINFYIIFTTLILHHELWVVFYLLFSVLANLALMLKVNAPAFNVQQISIHILKNLIIALPLSLILFVIFPRFHTPFWGVPVYHGKMGFTDTLTPGSLNALFNDERVAMRVTFTHPTKPNQYWTGLYLSRYNGLSFRATPEHAHTFSSLKIEPSTKPLDYEVLLEPNQKKWLFFLNTPLAGSPALKYAQAIGLTLQNAKPIRQRLAYRLKSGKPATKTLSTRERNRNLYFPKKANPLLQQWASTIHQKTGGNTQAIIAYIHHYLLNQPFWYRLTPKPIGRNMNQLDVFWFQTREGYCEYYASATTFILRAMGIPARIVVGYYGGEWNPIAKYLTIRQKNAHAWVEYWQKNSGWKRLDPTTFISPKRIDQTIREYYQNQNRYAQLSSWDTPNFHISWLEKLKLSLDSARFFWEKWLLFYNAERQQNLLKNIGFGQWDWVNLTQASIGSLLLFLFISMMWYTARTKRRKTPIAKAYQRVQEELKKLNVKTNATFSFKKQLSLLVKKHPKLVFEAEHYLSNYETLRLQQKNSTTTANTTKTVRLLKSLRVTLKKYRKTRAC